MIDFLGIPRQRYEEQDRRTRALLRMMGVGLIASTCLLIPALIYALNFLVKSTIIASFFGLALGYAFWEHYKSLVFNSSKKTVAVALGISCFISLVVLLPLKFHLNQEHYREAYMRKNEEYWRQGVANASDEIARIEARKIELENKYQKGADNYSRKTRQSRADAKRIYEAFMETYEEQKMDARIVAAMSLGYDQNLEEPSYDELFRFFIAEIVSGQNKSETVIFILSALICFLIEGSPAIIALMLMDSQFMSSQRHDKKLKAIIIDKREAAEIELINDLDSLPKHLATWDMIDSVVKLFSNGFSNSDEVLQKYQTLQEASTPKLISPVSSELPSGDLDGDIPLLNYE